RHAIRWTPRADRHPGAGLEKAANPRRGRLAVGLEDDPPARHCGIEAVVLEVQGRGIGLQELDVLETCCGRALAAEREHLGRDVRGHDAALRPSYPGSRQRRLAVPGRDVEHAAPRLHPGELHQALVDRGGGSVEQLVPLAPARSGAVPLIPLPVAERAGVDRLRVHDTSRFVGRRIVPGKELSARVPAMSERALVTGASSGIGAEFAKQLSAEGYEVILVARRTERLEQLASELSGQAHVIPCDLASDAASLPGNIAERGLDVDLLVNNAGFGTHGRFTEIDSERDAEL